MANVLQNFSDFIMKWAIFEEHSSSCVVYSRFSGTLFPVSMIDGESWKYIVYACYIPISSV